MFEVHQTLTSRAGQSSPTIPVNDPICDSHVISLQGLNVIQQIPNRQGHVPFSFGCIKRHKQNLCFIWIVCWLKGSQLNANWLTEVFQELMQLNEPNTSKVVWICEGSFQV